MKKRIVTLIGIVLTTGLLTACGANNSTSVAENTTETTTETQEETVEETKEEASESLLDKQDTIRIAAADSGISIYQSIVEANNLTEGLNLTIEWVDGLSSGPEIIAAITGGSVDLGKVGDFPVITNYGGGETPAFKVVGFATRGTDSLLFTSADSGLDTIESLKGKKVGTQIGTGSQFQLENSLAKGGLTIDDIELVNLDNASWLSTYVGNQVDAICILTDVTVDNPELGEINRLDETELALQSFIANIEWADANPSAVAKALIVIHRIYEYYAQNPDAAIEQVIAKNPEASSVRVKFILDELSDYVLSGDWDVAVSRYTDLKDFVLKVGTIDEDFDVNSVYDRQFVELANELLSEVK